MITYFFLVLSAFLHTLSFPNLLRPSWAGWQAGVAWVALVPYLWSVARAATPRQAAWRGWVFGALSQAGILYWIAGMEELGPLAIPAWLGLSAALGLYQALFGLGAFLLMRNTECGMRDTFRIPNPAFRMMWSCFLVPGWWVVVEWLKAHAFTGFPWALVGQSQLFNVPLIQWAAWGGVYAVSFWVVWGNVALAGLVGALGEKPLLVGRVLLASLALDAVLVAHGVGWWAWKAEAGREDRRGIQVTLLQGNVPQPEKWSEEFVERNWNTYADMVGGLDGAELVVWPETAVPFLLEARSPGRARVEALVKRVGGSHVIGAPHLERSAAGAPPVFANRVWVFGSGGSESTYDKRHLVPFGEFTPFGWLKPLVERYTIGVGEFRRGTGPVVLTAATVPIAPLICYEAIFPHDVRSAVRQGAELLVNVTNDAWFGRSAAAYQHAQAAAVRAVETRRTLVRAANTGVSCVVEPWGEIQTASGLFEQDVVMGMAELRDGESVYVRYGEAWVLVAGVAAWLAMFWVAQRSKEQSAT